MTKKKAKSSATSVSLNQTPKKIISGSVYNQKSLKIMSLVGICTCILVSVVCVTLYHYTSATVTAPSDETTDDLNSVCGNKDIWRPVARKVRDEEGSASWGSLRPGVYFGMKTRSEPAFLTTGIMWSAGSSLTKRNFRHAVHTDEIDHFEWLRHNGRTFGIQQLRDAAAQLLFNATFMVEPVHDDTQQKHWAQHFNIKRPTSKSKKRNRVSFIHYFGMDCDASDEHPLCFSIGKDIRDIEVDVFAQEADKSTVVKVIGFSSLSGWFSLTYKAIDLGIDINSTAPQVSYYGPKASKKKGGSGIPRTIEKIHKAKDFMTTRSASRKEKPLSPSSDEGILFGEGDDLPNIVEANAVGVFIQFLSTSPMELRVVYRSHVDWKTKEDIGRHAYEDSEEIFSSNILSLSDDFDREFEEKFSLSKATAFTEKEIEIAKRGLSNLLGGLGYFHGTPVIGDSFDFNPSSSTHKTNVKKHDNALTLFSGTPSRSSFPRGFLWDEGFHQMLMRNWDPYITMEVLSSWMGCMFTAKAVNSLTTNKSENNDCRGGWIPRELILGHEARKVVPDEFVTQRVDIANPPTLLIVVEKLVQSVHGHFSRPQECSFGDGFCSVNDEKLQKDIILFLVESYHALHNWVQWFIDSQGEKKQGSTASPSTFRWRGRPTDSSRLAPNTLASGLDDYPRSQFPSKDERHVDLLSWIALSCRIMKTVGETLLSGKDGGLGLELPVNFLSEVERIQSQFYSEDVVSTYVNNLVAYHWSPESKMFHDVGLIGENEKIDVGVMVRCKNKRGHFKDSLVEVPLLQRSRGRESVVCPADFPSYMYPLGDGHGGLQMGNMYSSSKSLSVGFIPRVGYVNIFPFILKLLPADSPQLEFSLDLISSPSHLWSAHGLRSLSKNDIFYQKENAPGDSPYWRGPIWMPINYLALSALKHYSLIDEFPHHRRAGEIYEKLRRNLMRTVLTEYEKSGYFWEIYDDSSGNGMRGHPFSGWTTLFVNIMAELY